MINQGIDLYTPNNPYTTTGTKSVAIENPNYGACSRRIQDFVITLEECQSTASSENTDSAIPVVYPNPFENKVEFRFSNALGHEVEILIYDLAGRVITRIDGTRVQDGFQIAPWFTNHLSSSVYLYQIKAEEKVFRGRLLKL